MFGLGMPELIVFVIFPLTILGLVLPFFVNYKLAKTRGKDVLMVMLLTMVFSWFVTLLLVLLPETHSKEGEILLSRK
jgi:hypothetical protein